MERETIQNKIVLPQEYYVSSADDSDANYMEYVEPRKFVVERQNGVVMFCLDPEMLIDNGNNNIRRTGLRKISALKFLTQGGENIDLLKLLPPGMEILMRNRCMFLAGGMFADPGQEIQENLVAEKGTVIIPREVFANNENGAKQKIPFFKKDGSFFVFLHEIGHADSFHQSPEDQRKSRFYLEKIWNAENIEIHAVSFLESVLREEKKASIFAIKKLSELRKSGIDLEPSLDKSKVIGLMLQSLKSSLTDIQGMLSESKKR